MRATIEVYDPKPEPKIPTFSGRDFFMSKMEKRVGSEKRSHHHMSSERASSILLRSEKSASELS